MMVVKKRHPRSIRRIVDTERIGYMRAIASKSRVGRIRLAVRRGRYSFVHCP